MSRLPGKTPRVQATRREAHLAAAPRGEHVPYLGPLPMALRAADAPADPIPSASQMTTVLHTYCDGADWLCVGGCLGKILQCGTFGRLQRWWDGDWGGLCCVLASTVRVVHPVGFEQMPEWCGYSVPGWGGFQNGAWLDVSGTLSSHLGEVWNFCVEKRS